MAERDPFVDLPKTQQGLGLYTGYAGKEIKRYERKIEVLKKNIEEAKRRLGTTQEDVNATISTDEKS